MRMWMINPKILCKQHLLGEHVEIHMLVGTINLNKSINGYIKKGLVEVHNLYSRHEELVEEMKNRRFNHFSNLDKKWKFAKKDGKTTKSIVRLSIILSSLHLNSIHDYIRDGSLCPTNHRTYNLNSLLCDESQECE